MALQPWTAPPGAQADGDGEDGALALVTTATGQRVTVAEYERRVKEVRVRKQFVQRERERAHTAERGARLSDGRRVRSAHVRVPGGGSRE